MRYEISSRYGVAVFIMAFACTISTPPTLAQQGAKAVGAQQWRPKDGLYFDAGAKLTGPCEDEGAFLLELSKRSFIVNESVGYRIAKIIDTAPGALRPDMTCDASEITGDKAHTETMMLRKIDDESFFVKWSRKGEIAGPAWRANYCHRSP
jgi:hypothetical protein